MIQKGNSGHNFEAGWGGRKALVTELVISVFWNLIIPLWELKTLSAFRSGNSLSEPFPPPPLNLWPQLPSFFTVDCLSSSSFHSSCRRRTCTSAHVLELVLGEQSLSLTSEGSAFFFLELCVAFDAVGRVVL